ncbi:DUF2254 domain-containing protein [Micromonospora sp. Llam7]|nr:DUF2254 domain-containing protein [Micromonospora tarapacensis]
MSRPRSLSRRLAEIRESFWLVPATFALGAVMAAFGLSVLELQLDLPVEGILPSGPAGARSLLSSIITAMISFTALVFSITVVALQLASSQYSPRVLRTFLQDRIIQATLGTFVATFLFAMVVLAALPAQDAEGLPELSLAVSISLVLASTGTFIYYLHHITTVMRVSHIIAAIGAQTRRSITGLPPPDESRAAVPGAVTQTVPAPKAGMISNVDLALLALLAREYDCAFTLAPAPGDFVVEGAPLVRVHQIAGGRARRVPVERVNQGVTIGVERTPGQDVGFGFRQLADVAERALSPSVNDVTTAVRAVQETHDLLRRLATRPDPVHVVRDDDGTPRVRFNGVRYDVLLAVVVDDIRLVSAQQPRVTRLLEAVLRDLATVALPAHQTAIRRRLSSPPGDGQPGCPRRRRRAAGCSTAGPGRSSAGHPAGVVSAAAGTRWTGRSQAPVAGSAAPAPVRQPVGGRVGRAARVGRCRPAPRPRPAWWSPGGSRSGSPRRRSGPTGSGAPAGDRRPAGEMFLRRPNAAWPTPRR